MFLGNKLEVNHLYRIDCNLYMHTFIIRIISITNESIIFHNMVGLTSIISKKDFEKEYRIIEHLGETK